jgi:hypothetical protein
MMVFQQTRKQHSTSSFSFFVNTFLSIFVFIMSIKESFVEKLQRKSRKRLLKLREKKQERKKIEFFQNFAFIV